MRSTAARAGHVFTGLTSGHVRGHALLAPFADKVYGTSARHHTFAVRAVAVSAQGDVIASSDVSGRVAVLCADSGSR
jgi:hypothetical protein